MFHRFPEGENDGTEAQCKKATLSDMREMVHSELASWGAAKDVRRQRMPTAMARQKMCRMELAKPSLF